MRKPASTTTVVAGNRAIATNHVSSAADRRNTAAGLRDTVADRLDTTADRRSTATNCFQSRGNLPLRNLGHVLDWNDRFGCTDLTSLFVLL